MNLTWRGGGDDGLLRGDTTTPLIVGQRAALKGRVLKRTGGMESRAFLETNKNTVLTQWLSTPVDCFALHRWYAFGMKSDPIIQRASEIRGSGKQWLENLLGHPLRANQQIFILAFTPGQPPTAADRRKALGGLENTWKKVQPYQRKHRISAKKFDAAIEEARGRIRRRSS